MLADTPLVKNLSNPQYVEIILNGHNTLEDRFAEIDVRLVRSSTLRPLAGCERYPLLAARHWRQKKA
jgi:hypothetical protein